MSSDIQRILFTDYFRIHPDCMEEYGAFNISLVADLPLFIDPFLLFNSDKPEYRNEHSKMIAYLTFLRDKSANEKVDEGLLRAWYHFSEVKETWLGYSKEGNGGTGLGRNFAAALDRSFYRMFGDGDAGITRGKHLEKLCLITAGVGRDNISDFTTNLIKQYLLEYTQQFARTFLKPQQCHIFSVEKVRFDYATEHWVTGQFYMPCVMTSTKAGFVRTYVILVPKDLLTSHETWINRTDLIDAFDDLPTSSVDSAIRAEFNNYLIMALGDSSPKKDERRKIIGELLEQHPDFIDHYIRFKEDHGDQAVAESSVKVQYAESLFLDNFTKLAALVTHKTDFYNHGMTTLRGTRHRVTCLKVAIEEHGGSQFLYDADDNPVPTEQELRIAYRFLWLNATKIGTSNSSGDGQATDIPILPNSRDIVRVEFKLASNNQLKSYLNKQADPDANSGKTKAAITVIFCFSDSQRQTVESYLHEVSGGSHEVVLINAYEQHGWQEKTAAHDGTHAVASRFALVIGVANYDHIGGLPQAVLNDVRDVHDTLRAPDLCGYPSENMRLLVDKDATAQGIRDGLDWLSDRVGPSDTAVVYFSGHGGSVTGTSGTQTYLLPFDCRAYDIPGTALSGTEFTDRLRGITAQRLVVLLDSCHSGSTGEPKAIVPEVGAFKAGLPESYYTRLAEGTGRVVIASSRGTEVSFVLNGMANSLFTHHLLDALRGKALTRQDGLIRVLDVFTYISERVPGQAAQHPVLKATDVEDNFPIALYQGGKKELAAGTHSLIVGSEADERAIRQAITTAFNLEELEILCADVEQDLRRDGIIVAVSLEEVGGQGKEAKIMRLVQYLNRRGHVSYLTAAVNKARPGLI